MVIDRQALLRKKVMERRFYFMIKNVDLSSNNEDKHIFKWEGRKYKGSGGRGGSRGQAAEFNHNGNVVRCTIAFLADLASLHLLENSLRYNE